MRRLPLPALILTLVALSGCGSSTKTVTVASAPEPAHTETTAPTQTTATTPSTTTTATTPSEPSTTRTAPEPSFTETESHSAESSSAATAVLSAHGYTAKDSAEYHPGQTLRVLVGTRNSNSEQQAFFFLEGHYIGTDTKDPSGQISVVSQSDTEVAIAYGLYRGGDSSCCPSGGRQVVHFALNDGHLTALDPIPSLATRK